MITADMWDDPGFVSLSINSRLLWCWFGSCQSVLPGVVRGGVMTFAEGAHVESAVVLECLQELIEVDRVLFDEPRRMLVLNEPPERPWNHNALKAWWRKWQQLPDCELRYHYVGLLERSVGGRWGEVWSATFGTVQNPVSQITSPPQQIAPNDTRNIRETYGLFQDCNSSEKATDTGDLGMIRVSYPESPRSRSRSRSRSGSRHITRNIHVQNGSASSLWELQEALRADLGLSSAPATPADLERVEAILADYSAADAERVLRFQAADVERDGAKARFFDGFTNWRPENFARALRMAPAPGNGASDPSGRGDALVDPEAHAQELARGAVSPAEGAEAIRRILEGGAPSGEPGGSESV